MAPDDLTHLEALIDKYGIDAVLGVLSEICGVKMQECAKYDAQAAKRLSEVEKTLRELL
jgi:hypothetical protein